ncbi:MAG: phospholipase A [Desulfurivibrionaceae bacterium]|nr:phospholipase A [Desulfurivibrionaceae bacterium]
MLMTRLLPGVFALQLSTILLTIMLGPSPAVLAAGYQECLLRALQESDDTLTLGEIKRGCQGAEKSGGSQERVDATLAAAERAPAPVAPEPHASRFSVSPHRQNYILFFSHNTAPNNTPYTDNPDASLDANEVTFQVSLKFPVGTLRLGDRKTYLMAAYTAQSFWQAYNKDLSSPFRETNHEPELFALVPLKLKIPGVDRTYLMAGLVHQSNGRSEPLSRSWNRLYVDFVLEGEHFKISLKPWYIIPEKTSGYLIGSGEDDNPDISDYMGYGEISGALKVQDHTLSFMLRNNLTYHDNKGALKLGWSFKMPFIEVENLKGYIHYFNGYGESLIDYNAAVQRFGLGLMLADWF